MILKNFSDDLPHLVAKVSRDALFDACQMHFIDRHADPTKMQLTKFSDYALRVLMFADGAGDTLVTIDQMAASYEVSRTHLMKVVNCLTRNGFLIAVRGRSGGLKLAKPSGNIRLGDVVRATEPDFSIVECFDGGTSCVIAGRCKLTAVMAEARDRFLETLDDYTLADISLKPRDFKRFASFAP